MDSFSCLLYPQRASSTRSVLLLYLKCYVISIDQSRGYPPVVLIYDIFLQHSLARSICSSASYLNLRVRESVFLFSLENRWIASALSHPFIQSVVYFVQSIDQLSAATQLPSLWFYFTIRLLKIFHSIYIDSVLSQKYCRQSIALWSIDRTIAFGCFSVSQVKRYKCPYQSLWQIISSVIRFNKNISLFSLQIAPIHSLSAIQLWFLLLV